MTLPSVYEQGKAAKEQGDRYYRESKFLEASQAYSEALQHLLQPIVNNQSIAEDCHNLIYVTYSNRCSSFLHLHQDIDALLDAQECVRLKTTWCKGYLRLGQCYQRLHRKHEAIAAYEQALEIEPQNIEAKSAVDKLKQAYSSTSSSTSSNNHANSSRNHTPQSSTGNTSRTNHSANTSQGSTNNSQSRSSYTSSSSSSTPQATPTNGGGGNSFMSSLNNINWQQILQKLQQQAIIMYYKAQQFWIQLPDETRKYIYAAIAILCAYYYFFVFSRNSYHDDYYSGYGHGGGGMSWMTWGVIMYSAYTIPPMFPDQLGQYARPFFGMSWTTFMWLVSFLNNNTRRGGGGYYGRPSAFGRRYY